MTIQVTISFANKLEMLDFFGAGAVLAPAPMTVAVVEQEAPKAKKSAKPAATPTVSATATTETAPEVSAPTEPAAASPSEAPAPAEEKKITLEEVRAKLAALSQDGKTAQVKALLTEFKAAKLTDLPAKDYPAILEKAEAL